MRWTGKITTENFRSRCTFCPERNIGSCLMATVMLGPDYRPDNCQGPQTLVQQDVGGMVGENFSFTFSVTTPVGRVCPQDRLTIPGQVVETGPAYEAPPPPALPPGQPPEIAE